MVGVQPIAKIGQLSKNIGVHYGHSANFNTFSLRIGRFLCVSAPKWKFF